MLSFECLTTGMMTEVCMCMWGDMIPKRGQDEFPTMITSYLLEMMASEDDHALEMASYPYASMDWRGCPYIIYTEYDLLDDRSNINVMFKLL